jgi:hypothetical protein
VLAGEETPAAYSRCPVGHRAFRVPQRVEIVSRASIVHRGSAKLQMLRAVPALAKERV